MELCERVIPRVVHTVNGRFIAAVRTRCPAKVSDTMLVTPPTPDEPQFEVAVCRDHADEIVNNEPLDEDRYTFCNYCRSYADLTTGMCGCL